ncbi:MAG: chemotaxis response regulator protein-glutamate methylesterase [Hyphomonadaceae bacterium]|nr:chemotaxis response regulator protein-glutamate methylesterase [Hyphomonadaceae bacterium]
MIASAVRAGDQPVRVMIVDDSAVVRGVIAQTLAATPGVAVAATASNGEMALMQLRSHRVDVIVLDIEMPVMDGLTALPLLAAQQPGVRIIMASTLTRRNADITLRALSLGAADYLAKPAQGLSAAEDFKRELAAKVLALGRPPAPSAAPPPAPGPSVRWRARGRPTVIAIGCSTGGPPALARVMPALARLEQPVLITQHMPATFTAMLAEQIERTTGRPCAEGKDGEPVQSGRSYIAPGGFHMLVSEQAGGAVLRITLDPPENFCRPAVDPMLRSVAGVYGAGALAVVLTGMGADGAKGCEAVAASGGRCIAQDEASSVVWGMPGAVARTGLAEEILPIDAIGPWIAQMAGGPA